MKRNEYGNEDNGKEKVQIFMIKISSGHHSIYKYILIAFFINDEYYINVNKI